MRIAVVGLGEAGETIHLPALSRLPDAEVVAACDPDATRREAARARWGVPCFDDLEQALAEARPEVVIVGTPPPTHAELCLLSLEAGCHVICEKPFVSSLREADRVMARAAEVGRAVALNHEFRALPAFKAVLDGVAAAGPGEPRFAQVWQLMHMPPWGEAGWRGTLRHRTLYEAGIHLVDFLVGVFRELPAAVYATLSAGGDRHRDVDAVALVTLEFSEGRLAQLVQTRLCRGGMRYFEARADTADASFRASHGGRARVTAGLYHSTRPELRVDVGLSGLAWKEVGRRRTVLARNPRNPLVHATADVFDRTLRAFRDGTKPPTTARDGRDLLAVIAACYASAERGCRIPLDEANVSELSGMTLGARSDPS